MTTALDRSFTYRLHLLHKASDQVSHQSYLQALGLSLSEARCLAAIGAFQPMSVMALADKGNLNKGQASRAAQILVDKGWVNKTEHPSDGRGVTLCLTPEGQKLWKKTMALIDQRILPARFETVICRNAVETADAIRTMVVRGAPAIGCAAAFEGRALGRPLPLQHPGQAVDHDVEEASDQEPEQGGQGDARGGRQRHQTTCPSLKIGRYMATTMPPMMEPSSTMTIGSIRLDRPATRSSTSAS